MTREDVASWKPGEVLLLNGKLLTGRDAAHKRIVDMLDKGEPLPVDLRGRFIYYVGPVDPVRDEVVGPAGPTTATRMDKFTEQVLAQTGLLGMVGKAERGPAAIEAIRKHRSVYLMAVGGAAYLVSKAIKAARVVGFADLGMEAIYEFEVQDMPVTVAVDSQRRVGARDRPEANGRRGSARFRSWWPDPHRQVAMNRAGNCRPDLRVVASVPLQQRDAQADVGRAVVVVDQAFAIAVEHLHVAAQGCGDRKAPVELCRAVRIVAAAQRMPRHQRELVVVPAMYQR